MLWKYVPGEMFCKLHTKIMEKLCSSHGKSIAETEAAYPHIAEALRIHYVGLMADHGISEAERMSMQEILGAGDRPMHFVRSDQYAYLNADQDQIVDDWARAYDGLYD